MSSVTPSAILLIHCQDRQRLVSAITSWVSRHHGNILEIDQHVDHRHSIDDLIRKGRDLEKVVLSRAIWHHLQYKTLIYRNRTIVF